MNFQDRTVNNIPRNFVNTNTQPQTPVYYKVIASLFWVLFAAGLVFITLNYSNMPTIDIKNLLRINGFSMLIWTTVMFFSAIITSYAGNYLNGFKYQGKFLILCLGFTASVLLLVIANHIVLLLISWLLMAVFMSQLIGINKKWGEAREASKFTLKYFLTGTLFLTAGLLLPAFYSNVFTLSKLTEIISDLPMFVTVPSALLIIAAAIVQSAIYPFHRWLLSAMTAPTPASALMHAGFVNGSGILLALFASLLVVSNTLDILFIIGGLTAIIAQFTKLLQVNVKHKLACSTIAQMGFMIMQCGLGFFNAAIAHLILHGFYKAYLFLSSGEEVAQTAPKKPLLIRIKSLQAIIVLLFGTMGAALFAFWTGKGTNLDSSIFLILIVAITVGQATYNITKERSLSLLQKTILMPILFVTGIGLYALMFNGVTILMVDTPMTINSLPLSWTQIVFGIIFLFGFFMMKLGGYQRLPWLYVQLMNLSQPHKKTVLMYKSKSI
ncbi:proton-conducting transporter transmembrane domain-containing protein [Aquimarina sp. M1]